MKHGCTGNQNLRSGTDQLTYIAGTDSPVYFNTEIVTLRMA